jgi:hypothetical protein
MIITYKCAGLTNFALLSLVKAHSVGYPQYECLALMTGGIWVVGSYCPSRVCVCVCVCGGGVCMCVCMCVCGVCVCVGVCGCVCAVGS